MVDCEQDTADEVPGLEYSSGEDSDMDMGEEMGEAVDMGEGMGEAVDMDCKRDLGMKKKKKRES